MEVLERQDHELGFVTVSLKVMKNGEVRKRARYADGTTTTVTTAAMWEPDMGVLPIQDPHTHCGLIEQYTLIKGWVAYFTQVPADPRQLKTVVHHRPGETITFRPGEDHAVLIGPGAKISTLLFGQPVQNDNRKGDDWWPSGANFEAALGQLTYADIVRAHGP